MKTDVSKADTDGIPAKRKSEGLVRAVSPCESGKGFPYAPVDWPNPGDVWGWRVGKRVKGSGFYSDRLLYVPKRLQEKPSKQLVLQSKPDVIRYLRSAFPEADINAFFASFTWDIPAVQSTKRGKCGPCPQSPPSAKQAGKMRKGDGVYKRTRKAASRKQSQITSGRCVPELVLDLPSVEEQTLASTGTTNALGSSQVSGSLAAIYPDDSVCYSPIDLKPQALKSLDESEAVLPHEDFDSFLDSLDEILSLPLPKAEISRSPSSQREGMTETRAKLSSLLAMGFASLAASNKLNELSALTVKLKNFSTLNPKDLSMLNLIQDIPMSSNSFLEAKKLSGEADKFFADLDAKIAHVAALRSEYNVAKEQLELSQAEEASALLSILEIDEQITALQSRRAALTQTVKMTNRKIVKCSSNQKKVMECLPKIVHEVQIANCEKQEWELKRKKSAEQEAKILAKFAPLEGFSF